MYNNINLCISSSALVCFCWSH